MSTFGQLKTDVDEWLARDDVAVTGGSISSIILLAESEIAKDIRCVVQEQHANLVTGASRFLDLPDDFLQMRQVFIDDVNGRRFLEYQTPEVIREQPTWISGRRTSFYTIEGDDDILGTSGEGSARLVLAPAPDSANPQTVEVYYWARFPAFTLDPDFNWLSLNHYDIYLWQTLKQAALFIQEEELAATYNELYQAARDSLRVSENRKRYRGNQWQSYGNPRTIV